MNDLSNTPESAESADPFGVAQQIAQAVIRHELVNIMTASDRVQRLFALSSPESIEGLTFTLAAMMSETLAVAPQTGLAAIQLLSADPAPGEFTDEELLQLVVALMAEAPMVPAVRDFITEDMEMAGVTATMIALPVALAFFERNAAGARSLTEAITALMDELNPQILEQMDAVMAPTRSFMASMLAKIA